MDAWRLWQEMAREAFEAASEAEASGHLRSAASRYYYAAYQAVTALLLYRGLIPPAGREAWSHSQTPTLIKNETETLVTSRNIRNNLAARLDELYRLRIRADYTAGRRLSVSDIDAIRRSSGFVLKVVNDILPETSL